MPRHDATAEGRHDKEHSNLRWLCARRNLIVRKRRDQYLHRSAMPAKSKSTTHAKHV